MDQGSVATAQKHRTSSLWYFLAYILFFGSLGVYGPYVNLYFDALEFDSEAIGQLVSVSTIAALLGQFMWATISDRAKRKKLVLIGLVGLSIGSILLFYVNQSFGFVMLVFIVFSVVFNPIVPLLDNMTLAGLKHTNVDYGRVRVGGTIGYSIAVVLSGWWLRDRYHLIFILLAAGLALCSLAIWQFKEVEEEDEATTESAPLHEVMNKNLLILIGLYFLFSMSMVFYNTFYPIFYTEIGGDSSTVGLIMFFCAISEIPIFLLVGRIQTKIGIKRLLFLATVLTAVRWMLSAYLVDLAAVLAVCLLHGIGFATFHHSVVTYVNRSLPVKLRARGQMIVNLVGGVLPRVIFGYVGGVLNDRIGTQTVLMGLGVALLVAAVVFWFSGFEERKG